MLLFFMALACPNQSYRFLGTLIVCKASIIGQWEDEFRLKTAQPNVLKVGIYHDKNAKRIKARDVPTYDVIITTYGMIERDSGTLFPEKRR